MNVEYLKKLEHLIKNWRINGDQIKKIDSRVDVIDKIVKGRETVDSGPLFYLDVLDNLTFLYKFIMFC